MSVAMAEAVLQGAASLADQPIHLAEHAVSIVGMQPLDPELLVVAHLPRRIAHDRIQIVADECAGVIAGDLSGVDDGGAGADQSLQVVHHRHTFAERLFSLFASRDVGPRPNDLQRTALLVPHHPEGVLDPDVMSVAMTEAIFDRASALFDQRTHLPEDALGIFWVQTDGPEILVLEHLPGGEAHDAGYVLADEGAGVVTCLIGVDDRRGHRHEVAQPFARGFQFGGAVLDVLLQLVMRPAKLLFLLLAGSEVGGEADHAGLLAVLVEEHRSRDQHRNAVTVLCPEHALKT